MIFDIPFYTEGVRSSLSHAGEVGVKEGALVLLIPICKGELRNSVPIAASQSRPTQSSMLDGTLHQFTVTVMTAVAVHHELRRAAVPSFTTHPSHLPQPAETPLQAQPVVLVSVEKYGFSRMVTGSSENSTAEPFS